MSPPPYPTEISSSFPCRGATGEVIGKGVQIPGVVTRSLPPALWSGFAHCPINLVNAQLGLQICQVERDATPLDIVGRRMIGGGQPGSPATPGSPCHPSRTNTRARRPSPPSCTTGPPSAAPRCGWSHPSQHPARLRLLPALHPDPARPALRDDRPDPPRRPDQRHHLVLRQQRLPPLRAPPGTDPMRPEPRQREGTLA